MGQFGTLGVGIVSVGDQVSASAHDNDEVRGGQDEGCQHAGGAGGAGRGDDQHARQYREAGAAAGRDAGVFVASAGDFAFIAGGASDSGRKLENYCSADSAADSDGESGGGNSGEDFQW